MAKEIAQLGVAVGRERILALGSVEPQGHGPAVLARLAAEGAAQSLNGRRAACVAEISWLIPP